MTTLSLAMEAHTCDRCRSQGVTTTTLVRMLPRPIIMFGELVVDEWWGCPVCQKPHYPVKKGLQKTVIARKRANRVAASARGQEIA